MRVNRMTYGHGLESIKRTVVLLLNDGQPHGECCRRAAPSRRWVQREDAGRKLEWSEWESRQEKEEVEEILGCQT